MAIIIIIIICPSLLDMTHEEMNEYWCKTNVSMVIAINYLYICIGGTKHYSCVR